jgi:2-keto-4-pentenoate hydratase
VLVSASEASRPVAKGATDSPSSCPERKASVFKYKATKLVRQGEVPRGRKAGLTELSPILSQAAENVDPSPLVAVRQVGSSVHARQTLLLGPQRQSVDRGAASPNEKEVIVALKANQFAPPASSESADSMEAIRHSGKHVLIGTDHHEIESMSQRSDLSHGFARAGSDLPCL